MTKIVIDAGHGGYDSGAVGKLSNEKDITLNVAKELKTQLIINGFDVRLTRETDVFVPIAERYKISNDYEANLFVSIHANSAGASAHGTEALVYPDDHSSYMFAQDLLIEWMKEFVLTNRGVKYRSDLGVLRGTRCSAVLLEMAFISNLNEETLMNERSFPHRAAVSICKGICNAYGKTYNYAETKRDKAMQIISNKCDTPELWIRYLNEIPFFEDFICKIAE